MKSSTELLSSIFPYSTASCNGVAVGNFCLSDGDILPPLEMHFCNSVFTASNFDPYSSWFPSDLHWSCKKVAHLTVLKWHEKKEGHLASISIFLFSPAKVSLYPLTVLSNADGCCSLLGAAISTLYNYAIWCRESCPFAPSEYSDSAVWAPETRQCICQTDKWSLLTMQAGYCNRGTSGYLSQLPWIMNWHETKLTGKCRFSAICEN